MVVLIPRPLLFCSTEGITRYKVEKLYRVGLVGKSGEMYAKASTDFIGVAIIDNIETLVAIECKARVTPGTHQREREHAELLVRVTIRVLVVPVRLSSTQ